MILSDGDRKALADYEDRHASDVLQAEDWTMAEMTLAVTMLLVNEVARLRTLVENTAASR